VGKGEGFVKRGGEEDGGGGLGRGGGEEGLRWGEER